MDHLIELYIFSRYFADHQMKIVIPPEYSSTEMYQGTLGHKPNHDFGAQTRLTITDTPR